MRSIGVGLVVAALLLGGACSSGGDGGGDSEENRAVATTTTAAPVTVGGLVASVDADRLTASLRAVVGERATPEQRAAARATLRRELEAADIDVTEQPFGDGGINLLGRIGPHDPGTPIVLVSAHYDTVPGSPGADDNGSGVAAALETGRTLAASPPDEHAVVLAFFDLEEQGLLGSRHYAANRDASAPTVAFNLDMVGYRCDEPGCQFVFPDVPGCMDVEGARDVGVGIAAVADEPSTFLLDGFVDVARSHVPDLEVGTAKMSGNGSCLPDTRRSDHAPLWDAGIPTVFLTDTANFRNPNYHKPSDTLETVDLALLTKVTRALTAAVARAAGVSG